MHDQTKATRIDRKTKLKVYERDGGLCVICHAPGLPEAHFIRRSQGGLGIEENIVTLCRKCHRDFDETEKRQEYTEKIRAYLDRFYPDFSDYDRTYHKWRKLAQIEK